MAILSSTGISGFLSSAKATGKQILNKAGKLIPEYIEDFVSGFAGHGWKIWNYRSEIDSENNELKKYKLEIDSLTVRESMTVFELLIQKIRAVKGALSITQASGRVATAVYDEKTSEWLLTVEDEMSFAAHDIIRCQSWDNGTLKGYWVEISEIRKIEGVDTIVIPAGEFSGGIGYDKNNNNAECVDKALTDMITPAAGDEIIQFGNSKVANRQSAVYIHADEGGQPAIDILFGITTKSFAGCVKTRIGGDIPGGDGVKGFYCENGMIKCVDDSGSLIYEFKPDGSFTLGKRKIVYDPTEDKLKFGAGVTLTWDNIADDAKDHLKGDTGDKGEKGDKGDPGKSVYRLDLTNENVSLPCTSDGFILSLSDLKELTKSVVQLYLGTSEVTNAVYGVSLNADFNRYVFNRAGNGMEFALTNIPVILDKVIATFTASVSGVVVGTAKMTITKVCAGNDGIPATMYYLVCYPTSFQLDSSGNFKNGDMLTVKAYKKTGTNDPVLCSDGEVFISVRNDGDDETVTSESGTLTVSAKSISSSLIVLLKDTGRTIILDNETIPILADGQDGQDGSDGGQGLPGLTILRSEWHPGIEYRNDEAQTDGLRYLSIVLVKDRVAATGWRPYKCLQTHISDDANMPGNTAYWEELAQNIPSIYTPLVIADNAKIDFLTGNEIRILDANNKVTAGVSGSGSGETGIRFYAGSADSQNAPFRVDENGKVIAKNGEFKGMIEALGISMSDCAKLASAIFKGDYMFSQQGKNSNGGDTSEYQKFGTSDFIPNLQINLNTGEIIGNKCNLRGSLLTEMKYVSGGNVTVGNKNSDYAYDGDAEVNLTIFLAPGGAYGTETNIFLFGNGKITMAYFLLGSYFLYNGKLYQKIELNSPGSFVSLKHVRISSSIPHSQGIGFAIKNPANLIPSSTNKDTLVFTWR